MRSPQADGIAPGRRRRAWRARARRAWAPPAAGFTLIELTVVLAVLVTLALVLTPAIANFINDSRMTRTRRDTQTIAAAITQFQRDTGFFPQWAQAQTGGPGTAANRVDLLVSGGAMPLAAQATPWITGTSDQLARQLLSNTAGYTMRGPSSQFGWNGPYLSSDIAGDAWGNRYIVNVAQLDATAGSQTATGALKSAVWVLSAGPNGTIETAYQQPITSAALGGDDIGFRVQ